MRNIYGRIVPHIGNIQKRPSLLHKKTNNTLVVTADCPMQRCAALRVLSINKHFLLNEYLNDVVGAQLCRVVQLRHAVLAGVPDVDAVFKQAERDFSVRKVLQIVMQEVFAKNVKLVDVDASGEEVDDCVAVAFLRGDPESVTTVLDVRIVQVLGDVAEEEAQDIRVGLVDGGVVEGGDSRHGETDVSFVDFCEDGIVADGEAQHVEGAVLKDRGDGVGSVDVRALHNEDSDKMLIVDRRCCDQRGNLRSEVVQVGARSSVKQKLGHIVSSIFHRGIKQSLTMDRVLVDANTGVQETLDCVDIVFHNGLNYRFVGCLGHHVLL